MTVDEVIAANVQRIRKDQNLSRADLAERMKVGRHIVYDYERPRPGNDQRAFLWSDLVKLCSALKVTLFELVLPPAEVRVNRPMVNELAMVVDGGDRGRLGLLLFGIDGNKLDSAALANAAKAAKQGHDELFKGFWNATRRFVDKAVESGYWSDEELREAGYVKEDE